MSESLLAKTRRLNSIIQSSGSKPVHFADLALVLGEILESNVYIASSKGKILGFNLIKKDNLIIRINETTKSNSLYDQCNRKFLEISKTSANIKVSDGCHLSHYAEENRDNLYTSIVPVSFGGDRLGTLIIERLGREYSDNDLVLAEYSATIVGMEIINAKSKKATEEAREKAVVQMAVRSLSFSELKAIDCILQELKGYEGLLIASKIADRAGITRSVIINALRKLESAGVIESRSLGMKGTHIKILNNQLLAEIERNR